MGENVVDETDEYFQNLSSQLTGLVKDIYRYLFKSKMNKVDKRLHDFILQVGPMGFMRMMGFRKTKGSQDLPWPNPKLLLENFN